MAEALPKTPIVLGKANLSAEESVHLIQPVDAADPIGFRTDLAESCCQDYSISLYFEPIDIQTGGMIVATVQSRSAHKLASVVLLKSGTCKTEVLLYPGEALNCSSCSFDVSTVSEGLIVERLARSQSAVSNIGTIRSPSARWISSLHVNHDVDSSELSFLIGCSQAAISFTDGSNGSILFEFLQIRYFADLDPDDFPANLDVVGTRTRDFRIYGQDSDGMSFREHL